MNRLRCLVCDSIAGAKRAAHAQIQICSYVVVLFVSSGESVLAQCNYANGDKYTLKIEGESAVSEGEQVFYSCIVENESDEERLDFSWSVTPLPENGSDGEGLTSSYTVAQNSKQLIYRFFWHARGGDTHPCQYKIKCWTNEKCIAEKTVTLTLPSGDWGNTGRGTQSGVQGVQGVEVGLFNKIEITDIRASSQHFPSRDANLFEGTGSNFFNKIAAHEGEHVSQLVGGTESPVAELIKYWTPIIMADEDLEVGSVISPTEFDELNVELEELLEYLIWGPNLDSWMETEAYTVSNEVDPQHFEPTPEQLCYTYPD